MNSTRRGFLAAGLAGVGATTLVKTAGSDEKDEIECLDFGRSFLCNPASFNAVRFWVESRTIFYDDEAGSQQVIYQCASCKSEDTFAERNLLLPDNYDFMPIYAEGNWLILRRHVDARDTYREVLDETRLWGKPSLKLHYGSSVVELSTFEEIRNVTATSLPLVAQTEIRNEDTGLRCVVEYPIKTMNISIDQSKWQVDTGPIALPDLTQRFDRLLDSVRLAFAVFNASHFCDFVIEQPTPIEQDEQEVGQVYHYSNPLSFPAKNRILALGGLQARR